MRLFKKSTTKNNSGSTILNMRVKFRKSIYGQVVLIITSLSVILFLSFGVIFKSVCERNMNTVIRQNGNNIGSLINGALYQSMMENDKT